MSFYFKGNQLFARRGDVPAGDQSEWTTFLMDMRVPIDIPNLDDFARFLATSVVWLFVLGDTDIFGSNSTI